eukprot:Amastigsp_a841576_81.p4 type:complete len:122 gc:universal Amastigsp_a841576_81:517-882(+)
MLHVSIHFSDAATLMSPTSLLTSASASRALNSNMNPDSVCSKRMTFCPKTISGRSGSPIASLISSACFELSIPPFAVVTVQPCTDTRSNRGGCAMAVATSDGMDTAAAVDDAAITRLSMEN